MLIRAGQYVQELFPELTTEPVAPQTERRIDKVESIRRARSEGIQDLSFGARPFILCGLPIRRLPAGTLMDRGARAIDGEFSFTEQNSMQPKEDSIFVYGPPAYLKKVGPQFQAPYRMLLPRKVDNLLVAGMCASTGGHVRAIAGCMPMGHAAGTAAAICAAAGVKPRDLDYRKLQAKLKTQGQIIDL